MLLNRHALCLVVVTIGSVLTSNAIAQLPNPVLTELFPRGIQIGTSAEVTVTGRDLDKPTELIFSHPGIQGVVKQIAASEFEGPRDSPNQFIVQVADNVVPGIYEARSVGRFGVSTPLPFCVHHETLGVEPGDNHSVERATPILVPSVIYGRADANRADYYRISVEAGTTLTIECIAAEIGSRIDPVVSILDNHGAPLQRSRAVRDTTLTRTISKSGELIIAIHDGVFAGGGEYVYALLISNRPVIDLVLPAAGQPGQITEFTFYGRNFPGGQESPFELDAHRLTKFSRRIYVPTEGELNATFNGIGGFRSRSFRCPIGEDSAAGGEVAIGIAAAPVTTESEPNERELATVVSLPVEYSGTFYPRRDQDWIRFSAQKGQQLLIEVHASPNGIEIDPAVYVWQVVQSSDGKESFVNRNVADDGKLDRGRYGRRVPRALDYSESNPTVQFTVPANGDYCVSARDLYGNGRNDPRATYRMVVKPSQPDFRLVGWTQRFRNENNNKRVERAALALQPGESREILVDVIREGGFLGPLTISATGAPDGVTCREMVVAAGQTEAAIVLTAAIDAEPAYSEIHIVGNAKIGGKLRTRHATFGLLTGDEGNIGAQRPSRRALASIFVSVKSAPDKSPAIVQLNSDKAWKSSVGATLKIPVNYVRNSEIKGELKMHSVELPGEIKPKELVLKPDAAALLEIPLNNAKVKPGKYSFFMTGQAAAKFTRNQAAIDSLERQLAEFDITLKQIQEKEQAAAALRDELKQPSAGAQPETANSEPAADGLPAGQAAAAEAEKKWQEATAKKQRAEQFRKSLAERIKNTQKQDGPRDAQIVVTSTPVTIEVAKSPLTISTSDIVATLPNNSSPKEGDALNAFSGELTIERHFGFDDAVQIEVSVPDGHPPIAIGPIAKGQKTAAVSGTAPQQTQPDRYEYAVKLKLKFGGVDIEDTTTIGVVVSKPDDKIPTTDPAPDQPAAAPAAK